MSLDKDKILSELNSVMTQLQGADCGCMDKLFANNHQASMRSCYGGSPGCCGSPCHFAASGDHMTPMGGQGNPMAMGKMGCQGNPMGMGGMGCQGNHMAMGGQGNAMGGNANPMAMRGMGGQGNPMGMGCQGNPMVMGSQGNPMGMGGQGNPMGMSGQGNPMGMGGQGNPMGMGGQRNPMGGQCMPMMGMNANLAEKNMQMYKDTFNYLNKNLMQPTIKEVMHDLSTMGGVVKTHPGGQHQGGDMNAMSGCGNAGMTNQAMGSSGMVNQGVTNPGMANMSMANNGNAEMSHGGQRMAGNIMRMMSNGDKMGGAMSNQGGMMGSNQNDGNFGQNVEAHNAQLGHQNMTEPGYPNMGGGAGMASSGQSIAEQIMGSMTTAGEKRRIAQGGGMPPGGMEMTNAGMHEQMHPGHGGMGSGMHASHPGQEHNMHTNANMMHSDQNAMHGHTDMTSHNAQHAGAMNAQAHSGMVQERTGNPNATQEHPGMMHENQAMMQGHPRMMQGNPNMAQAAGTGNAGPQQGNNMPCSRHMARKPCPRHTPGLVYNQLTPEGQGITEELGFDPMDVALQMNPENRKLAAVNTMSKLMNKKGGFNSFVHNFMGVPPASTPAPAKTPTEQLQQPPQQIQQAPHHLQQPPQELQQPPQQMQQPNQQMPQEMQQQQMIPEHHQQMSHEQQQQLTPEQQQNMQMEYQQMQHQQQAHPGHHQAGNVARPAEVYEPYPNQANPGIHLKKLIEPLYPARVNNYTPRHVEKPVPGEYDLNALGQPIQYVPSDKYYPIRQPEQQNLSPEAMPPSRYYPHAHDAMKQSYVKSTVSKTSIIQPRRSVARLPSKSNLHMNRGSHSATTPTSAGGGGYPQQASRSDGRLYMADPVPPQPARPMESVSKVAGDATSGQPNTMPPQQLQQITGQPEGVPYKENPPFPFPLKGKLNGLQDKNYGNIPNVSWSFGSRRISSPRYVR